MMGPAGSSDAWREPSVGDKISAPIAHRSGLSPDGRWENVDVIVVHHDGHGGQTAYTLRARIASDLVDEHTEAHACLAVERLANAYPDDGRKLANLRAHEPLDLGAPA